MYSKKERREYWKKRRRDKELKRLLKGGVKLKKNDEGKAVEMMRRFRELRKVEQCQVSQTL